MFTIVVVMAAGQKRKADYDVSELEWCGERKGANVCRVMLEVSVPGQKKLERSMCSVL